MKAEVYYGSLKKAGESNPALGHAARRALSYQREEPHDRYLVEVDMDKMELDDMKALIPLLEEAEDKRTVRIIKALGTFKEGDFDKSIPSFPAFPRGLKAFLAANHIRGWLFYENGGIMYPAAIVGIKVHEPHPRDKEDKPKCELILEYYGPTSRYGWRRNDEDSRGSFTKGTTSRTWEPADVVRKSIPDILTEYGLYIETPELLAEYDAHMAHFEKDMLPRFAEQLVVTSKRPRDDDELGPNGIRRVIHDLKPSEQKARPVATESHVLGKEVAVPMHPCIHTFDLTEHSFSWYHVSELAPYEYDPSLRDKLILPRSHRDLLDVLTDDLTVFSGDIIRGKSAGNIIICKGAPGLGKTLTAEVYSELTQTPIYSVHSGTMGTTPREVEGALKVIFRRQRRWGCIVLLDEADVFVKQRGDNLNQNAIVAEFLRTLEYFEGLMFMTTNRPDDIDDAIISRAAAIITYRPPSAAHAIRIWEVMFAQNGVEPDSDLLVALTELFPSIAPRDIKMLLRLVLRVATSKDVPITLDLFRRIAMFRAVEISDKPVELSPSESLI